MAKTDIDGLSSLRRLLRFLFWYAIVVAAAFYLLPWLGQWIQGAYDAMSIGARALSVLGIFALAALGQVGRMLSRSRPLSESGRSSQTNSL